MKKRMLIVVALAFMAATVQAVSLKWSGNTPSSMLLGPTGGNLTTGPGSETASITVYYILQTDQTAVQLLTDSTSVSAYAKATATGQTGTSTTYSGRAGTSSSVLASTSGIAYFARVYATIGGTQYYMDLKNGGTTAYWTTTASGNDGVFETQAWLTTATYGGTTGVSGDFNKWVAVPEPTSMALFALGAGVLGLRRRFRKNAKNA